MTGLCLAVRSNVTHLFQSDDHEQVYDDDDDKDDDDEFDKVEMDNKLDDYVACNDCISGGRT